MFGSRRHRPPNPPLTAATANPNAATAAAAVFKRHEPNPSLSAAAAAAALRARPMTPTRVADVLTKRTMRRSTSVATASSASDHVQDRPTLQRRGSSGSMTERTFRTPSPHRPGSSGSGHRRGQSVGDDMPPVPALPRNMDGAASRQGAAQQGNYQRKATSLGAGSAPVRLASQKLASGEAPSWFGAAKLGDLGTARRTDPAMASPPSSPLQVFARDEDLPEGARPNSQASSINFSYPTRTRRGSSTAPSPTDECGAAQMVAHTSQMRPHVQDEEEPARAAQSRDRRRVQSISPSASKSHTSTLSDQSLVYDPNSRRMVPRADLLAAQQAAMDATQAATRPKKQKKLPQRAGSHLAAGTMSRTKIATPNSAPAAKTVQPSGAAQAQVSQQVQPAPPKEPAPAQEASARVDGLGDEMEMASPTVDANRSEQQHLQQAPELSRSIAPVTSDSPQFVVRRQPSVVREEPEPESSGNEGPTQKVLSALDSVPGRRRMQAEAGPETHSPASTTPNQTIPPNSLSDSPAVARVDQKPKSVSVPVSEGGKPKPGATERGWDARNLRDRAHSNSPARQAHFGPVQDSLTVKHSPPPRSISPRKSAMKHTSPARAPSPSDDTSEASGHANQEPAVARKKSVRVSFDECAIGAAGDAASASGNDVRSAASPLHAGRQSWLPNVSRSQDLPAFDDDAVMKPRPALPSFGSVRDRKPRDISPDLSERPLVRPKGETRYPPALLPSPPLGPSNDHALGAVLSKEQARRSSERDMRAEQPSRSREPLPPIVTSVEGTGYFTDTTDNSSILSSEFEHSEALRPKPASEVRIAEPHIEVSKVSVNGSADHPVRDVVPAMVTMGHEVSMEPHVPAISVSQPTPPAADGKSPAQSYMDVPGWFPEDESDQSAPSPADASPQVLSLAQPAAVAQQGTAAEFTQPTATQDSSDSDSEVFSDAYEDLSEVDSEPEGDGFQSLDAVVDSPLQQSPHPPSQAGQAPRDAARHNHPEEVPELQTQLSSATTAVETQPPESPEDDWERAKAWWRSLTAEKRAELEREAMEEAGVEADRDEPPTEAEVNKNGTADRSASESRVLAAHVAQRTSAKQEKERAADPDRSYMIKPGERWTGGSENDIPPMRKTMRGESQQQARVKSAEGSLLRKSMRPSGPSGLRSDQARSKRPMSTPPAAAVLARPTHRRSATQEGDPPRPPVARRGSSGSDSSFKRSRTARIQGVGFRSSMRPTSPTSAHGDGRSSSTRFSLRALSPTGSESRQPANHSLSGIAEGTHMRTTLRDQPAGRKSSGGGGIRMPSFNLSYGGGKKHAGPKTSRTTKGSSGSRFSSRFADSSDEEGGPGGPSSSPGFRSRFEDSSDDDEPPVMPIPASTTSTASYAAAATGGAGHHVKKASSIASTALPEELEDSEEEQQQQHGGGGAASKPTRSGILPPSSSSAAAAVDTAGLRRTRSGRGQLGGTSSQNAAPSSVARGNGAAADGSSKKPKRNSIMSVLRHRRGSNSNKKDGSDSGKIGRPEIRESAARQDTRLERSVGQLELIRSRGDGEEEGEGVDEVVPSPIRSPRLQKRGSGKRGGSGSGGSSGVAALLKPTTTDAALAPAVGGGLATTTTTQGHGGGGILAGGSGSGKDSNTNNGNNNNDREEDHAFDTAAQLGRPNTSSGNLGTRTLSGGASFLHLHLHPHHHRHRRVSSSMGLETATAPAAASVDGSVAGSMAGASSTTGKKKRFGSLRRMFGFNS